MKKRKNTRYVRLGILFTFIILLLAGLGVSYGHWTDTLNIKGTVTTGIWETDETMWARMNDDSQDFTYEFPGSNWATYLIHQPTEDKNTSFLYAAQHFRVGEIDIHKDEDTLQLELNYDEGFSMSELHIHISTNLDDIPQNNGNPSPGQFDIKEEFETHKSSYIKQIQWDSNWDGKDLYIAVHAVVWGCF